jgi:hypothetical protein
MVNAGMDQLAQQIARGEYVVDAEAVAEAVLRRWREQPSLMLVTAQVLDGAAVGPAEDDPASGGDLA